MLRYADAVALLGGDSPAVAALDRALGGALLASTAGGSAVVAGLLGARGEVLRAGHDLVRGIRDRLHGYSRYDRTQRLHAAHTVLVVTAFFEAFDELELPLDLERVELTGEDQLRLAEPGSAEPGSAGQDVVQALLDAQVAMPGVDLPHETLLGQLSDWYGGMAGRWLGFLEGLSAWSDLDETQRQRAAATMREDLPPLAVRRYEDRYRRLALEVPEFAWWSGQQEHRATRRALAGIEELLRGVAAGRAPDQRRRGLARAYQDALTRPILADGDVPAGLTIPTLAAAYVDPDFRLATGLTDNSAANESFWETRPVRADLAAFLTAHLTGPAAVEAPLLVLGQPGAGKSVLTRILAARLPATDFMPIRVELRDAPADAMILDQIEHAIRAAINEKVDWSDLVGSTGDALPVVLLDGFDELLQATGVSQTDYLLRVADFQHREAVQERPVVVLVTSRTAVADRAQVPPGTAVLRLEPFRPEQIEQWLQVWNEVNQASFAARGVAQLPAAAVLRQPELAGQPLLLLMLALYDSDANALQRDAAALDEAQLYEQLLTLFAAREVHRQHPGATGSELAALVDDDLLRLSLVAFAMFNRGRQWATTAELDADLDVIDERRTPNHDLRRGLRSGETVLGRFFFMQRAQALRDGERLTTYEFLHATFGEYLVARLVHRLVVQMAAQERAALATPFGAGGSQDGLLHALLSFAPLVGRGPVLGFLRGFAGHLPAAQRVADLPVTLFQRLDTRGEDLRYARYQPTPVPPVGRYARYSLNLVLLAAVYGFGVHAGSLFPAAADVVARWRSLTLLWQSALGPEEWGALLFATRTRHAWNDAARDVRLEIEDPDAAPPEAVDLYWLNDIPPYHAPASANDVGIIGYRFISSEQLSRQAAFTADEVTALAVHAIEPFLAQPQGTANVLVGFPPWDRQARPDPMPVTMLGGQLRLLAAAVSQETDPATLAYLFRAALVPAARWSDVLDARTRTEALGIGLALLAVHSHRLPTDELTVLVQEVTASALDDGRRESLIEAVVNHLAAGQVDPVDAMQLRTLTEGFLRLDHAEYARWRVGLHEAGHRASETHPMIPGSALVDVEPRLLARARWLFRAEFGMDLPEPPGPP
jgi:hypothetical protein